MVDAPTPRLDIAAFRAEAPALYDALTAFGAGLKATGLEADLLELVKLRASQMNGCAFCLSYHLQLARKLGVTAAKLDLLAAWHDAALYSPRERAALALTEALTRLDAHGVPDSLYDAVSAVFSESERIGLIAAIGQINLWNRIGVGFRFPTV